MKTIWKFSIPVETDVTLYIPEGAKLLAFQSQRGQPTLWAEVDPDAVQAERHFIVRPTGCPYEEDPNERYVGTCQMMDGSLVWHLFEIVPGEMSCT